MLKMVPHHELSFVDIYFLVPSIQSLLRKANPRNMGLVKPV